MSSDSAPGSRTRREDEAADRRTLWVTAGAVGGMFALGAVAQAAYIFAAFVPSWQYVSVFARIGANTICVLVLLGTLAAWGQPRRTGRMGLVAGAVLSGLVAAVVRVLLQVAFWVYRDFSARTAGAELVSGSMIGICSAGLGTWVMVSRRRLRAEEREGARSAVAVELAVHALEDEEIRVRREVADGLHSSLQQRLILVVARVDRVRAAVAEGRGSQDHAIVAALDGVRDEIEDVREHTVRALSRLLYPDQLEIGMVPAVRALLRRIPSDIGTELAVDDEVRALDDPAAPVLSAAERLLAVRVVEEGLSNALRHGRPAALVVRLSTTDGFLRVAVEDDGGGFDPASVVTSGARRLEERLSLVGGTLILASTPGLGTRLEATLRIASSET